MAVHQTVCYGVCAPCVPVNGRTVWLPAWLEYTLHFSIQLACQIIACNVKRCNIGKKSELSHRDHHRVDQQQTAKRQKSSLPSSAKLI